MLVVACGGKDKSPTSPTTVTATLTAPVLDSPAVNEQLDTIMKSSFEDVVRYAETHQVNNRIAAYMLAIDRVAYTIRQRGIYA